MTKNYARIYENTLAELKTDGKRPRLLLHVCCAPCSSACLESLAEVFEITVFFYNPNISPEEEFTVREKELLRFLGEAGYASVAVDAPAYDPAPFLALAEGREDLPEGGARCFDCYALRLRRTAEAARAGGYDYFTTTLSVSPHKNAAWLNEIGLAAGEEAGVPYLCSDFKKKDGYRRSIELSKKYGLYRQDYCGCEYSRRARHGEGAE